jgi:hypothetical protein
VPPELDFFHKRVFRFAGHRRVGGLGKVRGGVPRAAGGEADGFRECA